MMDLKKGEKATERIRKSDLTADVSGGASVFFEAG